MKLLLALILILTSLIVSAQQPIQGGVTIAGKRFFGSSYTIDTFKAVIYYQALTGINHTADGFAMIRNLKPKKDTTYFDGGFNMIQGSIQHVIFAQNPLKHFQVHNDYTDSLMMAKHKHS